VLKLDVREGVSRDWVEASVRYAASELTAGRFASSSLMSRLSELLFVEALRQYSVTFTDEDTGWLKGVADPQIGRALAAIHHNIGLPWSAESLAKEVAMSRSAFVDRFTTLIGLPPIRYLTIWRLQTARLGLRETRKPIAQLAEEAGYGSGEAFSRAFKREFGLSPAVWRDQQPVD
jgi:transcriptional regulator GlxA family with amidase domain